MHALKQWTSVKQLQVCPCSFTFRLKIEGKRKRIQLPQQKSVIFSQALHIFHKAVAEKHTLILVACLNCTHMWTTRNGLLKHRPENHCSLGAVANTLAGEAHTLV